MEKKITEEMLDTLRKEVSDGMSEKRFRHTAEVEKMVARLAELYLPDEAMALRAAALLHDITKEASAPEQLRLCAVYGIDVDESDLHAPKTFHAKTAAALIPERYPQFADQKIIDCVRYHTTGRRGMTLAEQLVYLADYIDMSRSFEDCVRLRDYFWGAEPQSMDSGARLSHLRDTLILSYDMTVLALLEEGGVISKDTIEARNELICQKKNEA